MAFRLVTSGLQDQSYNSHMYRISTIWSREVKRAFREYVPARYSKLVIALYVAIIASIYTLVFINVGFGMESFVFGSRLALFFTGLTVVPTYLLGYLYFVPRHDQRLFGKPVIASTLKAIAGAVVFIMTLIGLVALLVYLGVGK